MATEVKVPPMGESISSGVLATWRVKDGESVKAGQSLYDLETDKITQEGIADTAGVIRLKVAIGTEVKVGEVLAVIEEGSNATAPASPAQTPAPAQTSAPAPSAPVETAKPAAAPKGNFPPSPAVRRIAAETGIDPATVEGSGKAGRVTKGDMLAAAPAPKDAPAAVPAAPVSVAPVAVAAPVAATTPVKAPVSAGDRVTRTKMSPLRKKIAERLVSAQHTAAILTTFNEVDMSAVMELRKKHQEAFVAKHGIKLGFMSFFVKAVVNALKEVPAVNAQLEGDEIVQNNFYDIGVAVSTPRGLMVPVVRDCDALNMAGVENAIAAYGKKAKEGKIAIDDLQGGVFTISNGGIFGSMLSTPILNPPQSGILGLHAIKDRPMAVNGQVVIRPMMYLALSYDHRLVDGREAVTFLIKVKDAIEEPTRLLLEV